MWFYIVGFFVVMGMLSIFWAYTDTRKDQAALLAVEKARLKHLAAYKDWSSV